MTEEKILEVSSENRHIGCGCAKKINLCNKVCLTALPWSELHSSPL